MLSGGSSAPKYEKRDANLKLGPIFIIGFIILMVVVLLSMRALFNALAAREANRDAPPSLLADTRQPTPQPRLQLNPPTDLHAMRSHEDALLNSYKWISKETQLVRIPIERAMELLAERGLPVRAKVNQ